MPSGGEEVLGRSTILLATGVPVVMYFWCLGWYPWPIGLHIMTFDNFADAFVILSRVGLHIWSVTWPLASRGTHPVVGYNSHFYQTMFSPHISNVSTHIQILSRWVWPHHPVHSQNQAIAGFTVEFVHLSKLGAPLLHDLC